MGAFFIVLLDTMQKVSYAKPWLNIDDQLSKLESRNLLIPDKELQISMQKDILEKDIMVDVNI